MATIRGSTSIFTSTSILKNVQADNIWTDVAIDTGGVGRGQTTSG